MKIYFAGNTPDRLKEEIILIKKGYMRTKLISFWYVITDKGLINTIQYLGLKLK